MPGIASIGSGRWHMPKLTLTSVLGQLPIDPADGDYRVLWIGDPRVMPVTPWAYAPGIAYAITDDGPFQLEDAWAGIPTVVEQDVTAAIDAIRVPVDATRPADCSPRTAIRYIVVPVADGALSTVEDPLPLPDGLLDALDDQLDLSTPLTKPLNYVVYENTAWTPTRSQLSGNGIEASKLAGGLALAQSDLRGSVPFAVGAPDDGPAVGRRAAGHGSTMAVPFDGNWELTVDGQEIDPQRAFGTMIGFDVAIAGEARLEFRTPASRALAIIGQLVVWLLLLMLASRLSPALLPAPSSWACNGGGPAGAHVRHAHRPARRRRRRAHGATRSAACSAPRRRRREAAGDDRRCSAVNARRVPALVVVLVAAVLLVVVGASRPTPRATVFTELGDPTQPFVPQRTSSPRRGSARVRPSHRRAATRPAPAGKWSSPTRPTFLSPVGSPCSPMQPTRPASPRRFQVEPRQSSRIELTAMQPTGTYVSAMVEITEGGGFVEQVARTPAGAAVAPCSNSTSVDVVLRRRLHGGRTATRIWSSRTRSPTTPSSTSASPPSRAVAARRPCRVPGQGNSVIVIQVDTDRAATTR